MAVELMRIDDRLIHGQVVVGWGQPLDIDFIVLVDDEVASSDWEQELYRMGVPPEMEVIFASVEAAAQALPTYEADERRGIVLTGDIGSMRRLLEANGQVRKVNLGGLHHRAGRAQRLRYIFLSADEEAELRAMARRGVEITAQDVPSARPVPLASVLDGSAA